VTSDSWLKLIIKYEEGLGTWRLIRDWSWLSTLRVWFKSVASFCHPHYLLKTSPRSSPRAWNSRIWHFHLNNTLLPRRNVWNLVFATSRSESMKLTCQFRRFLARTFRPMIWRPIPSPWLNLTEVKKTCPVTKLERWFDMSYLLYCWDHSDGLTCQIFDTAGNTDFLELESAWVVRVLVVGTAWRWRSWLYTLATCRVRNLEKSMLHLQWLPRQEENEPETRMTRRPCHGLLRWNYQWTWTWEH